MMTPKKGNLEPKRCPACGKNCIPREGRNGPFMGCPDFPKCPGRTPIENIEKVSTDEMEQSMMKLRMCYDFINRMGGTVEALRWLDLAVKVVSPPPGSSDWSKKDGKGRKDPILHAPPGSPMSKIDLKQGDDEVPGDQ